MKTSELLIDAFGRLDGLVPPLLKDADAAKLNWRPEGTGNSIAWLVWHLSRVQDDQIADVAGTESVWKSHGYAAQFGFNLDPADTGYGHTSEQVSEVRVESGKLLESYFRESSVACLAYVSTLADADLDTVVDTRWTPHVTLGVRLVSILDDIIQHAGQASYVHGLNGR